MLMAVIFFMTIEQKIYSRASSNQILVFTTISKCHTDLINQMSRFPKDASHYKFSRTFVRLTCVNVSTFWIKSRYSGFNILDSLPNYRKQKTKHL